MVPLISKYKIIRYDLVKIKLDKVGPSVLIKYQILLYQIYIQ
jgi:hypothetical protein